MRLQGGDSAGSQDTESQNNHHQNYPQQQQQQPTQHQQFNNQRSPNGVQNDEQKYQPGMHTSTTPENRLGSPLSDIPLQVQLSEG